MAAIDLRAGRKAKASAAYASARAYFAAGMGLLEDEDWSSQYELTFSLWLERAECELLCGHSEEAGQLIEQLLPRAASKVDEAAVSCLKVQLQIMKSENAAGCDHRAHVPARVRHRHARASDRGARPVRLRNSLASPRWASDREPDRPAVDDRSGAAGRHADAFGPHSLRVLYGPTLVSPADLPHGDHQPAARGDHGFRRRLCIFGIGLTVVHRYGDGYRFAKLACDLLDKYGFIANRATVYATFGTVAAWTQPIGDRDRFHRSGIPAAIETGNLDRRLHRYVHYLITYLLLRGRPTRRGVARVGDGAGLRTKGQIRRRRGHRS